MAVSGIGASHRLGKHERGRGTAQPNGGGPEAVIGEDKIDWTSVFAICETTGGTQWYVVEHETSKSPLATVERTFAALKKLGKV